MQSLLLIAAIVFAVYKCTGGGFGTDRLFGPPDELPQSRYEDLDVGVFFTYPRGSELTPRFLGVTKGAGSCSAIAHNFAQREGLNRNSGWSYICCTHESGSDCHRKIR